MGIFEYDFTVRALAAAAILGLVLPTLGVLLVMRQLSLVADTIAHVALAGVAVGIVVVQVYPVWIGIGGSAVSSVLIEEVRLRRKLPGEAVLAVFLYSSLALSLALFSLAGNASGGLTLVSYLFGNLFGVSWLDLAVVGSVMLSVLAVLTITYRQLCLIAFDADLASVSGIRVNWFTRLLALLTGVSVAVGMLVVGTLMVGTLLVLPALVALRHQRGIAKTFVTAALLGLVCGVGGTFLAYYTNLPASTSIATFGITLLVVTELGSAAGGLKLKLTGRT